jgi:hypothetical protein
MSGMKNAWVAVAVLLAAGCGKKEEGADSCCQKSEPPKAAAPRGITRPGGVVLTGLPESPDLAACDARGRWGVKTPAIEHSIVDPKEKGPLLAAECSPQLSLYRESLPFPQVNWKSGDWEVTQLVFPVGKGFVARYHVMNHGEDPRTGQLKVGGSGITLAAHDQKPSSSLTFDLKVDPGVSVFINVTTEDLAGKVADDALDQATAAWEKLIGSRGLQLPDAAAVTDYYANLAGKLLGVEGCAEAVAKTEAMLIRREGNALRLMAGMPEPWQLEAIEAREIPTDFGPLSFRYQGVYNNRTLELKPGCKPPDGFLVSVPPKLVPKIDGKDAKAKDGVLGVPAGANFVELSYPR